MIEPNICFDLHRLSVYLGFISFCVKTFFFFFFNICSFYWKDL